MPLPPAAQILARFHPAVAAWFARAFDAPTAPQVQAWPTIQEGRHVLIAAPTGSGKTLAAFLAAIDSLVEQGVRGELADETQIVYVSPLKALSNDIQRNLEWPLAGIREELAARGLPAFDIRAVVRTGDTPQAERERMKRRAPHIVVTTPESLYILLGSESGRKMLATVRTVIVDEIHAIVGDKRGVHLALTLERLQALAGRRLVRVGLSATQKPIDAVARFLVGARDESCVIVDSGHVRRRDLAIEVPASPLEAVMSGEVWSQVHDRLAELIGEHRTTLVFVNTRRLAERIARHLSERIGAQNVAAHHGSLAREQRLDAEQRLKRGELKVLVATASLELGIDIGDVDLVCQIGSTRTISAFLQRVGRSGHAVGGTPKGRLFPLSRDDLLASTALVDAVRRGELDRLLMPRNTLDVVAQQIVAEVASREVTDEDELYALIRRAEPCAELARADFDQIVQMLAQGFSTRRGRSSAHIHRDAVNRKLSPRRGARLTALTSAGTIPDNADYDVILQPEDTRIGSVNEDFAIESMSGDIFQLGNHSYRILRIDAGRLRVEDAQGLPPSIPFWIGEAPARTDELSLSVSRLTREIEARADGAGRDAAVAWLVTEVGVGPAPAAQLVDYLVVAKKTLGVLPALDTIVLERFFDESGGMQLVFHSPYGSRVNRAWGLALRKRFCRQFNFELQAAATEDAIVLSLGTSHSFPLEDVAAYLRSATVRPLLVQAMLAAPMFATRWRWNATIALALPRTRGGKRVPTQLQRMIAEDLLAAVFPDQLACAENIVGDREIPDDPLVRQTIDDCLHVAMDIDGLERLLAGIESGAVRVVARDLTEPSPLAQEILSARPYAFLDDAPLEERRTQAVMGRRWLDPAGAADLGQLDAAAIQRVREEVWPDAVTADELHDGLLWLGFLTADEAASVPAWAALLDRLCESKRVALLSTNAAGARRLWLAAERLPQLSAVYPEATMEPSVVAPEPFAGVAWERDAALVELVRGRLEGLGPARAGDIAASFGLPQADIDAALLRLEVEGSILRGSYTPGTTGVEWCERRLLARIHRYTVKRLRAEIAPVSSAEFLRFLLAWQHAAPQARMSGPDAVAAIVGALEGYEAAAGAWETEILPLRVSDYEPEWLDELCLKGRAAWMRLSPPRVEPGAEASPTPVRVTPIALLTRRNLSLFAGLAAEIEPPRLRSGARAVHEFLTARGASFFDEILEGTRLLRTQAEEAIGELVALGLVSSDSFIGLRALLLPLDRRKPIGGGRRRRRTALFGIEDAGRWTLARRAACAEAAAAAATDAAEVVARTLLKRYGVVFWRLLEREAGCLPPWRDLLRTLRRLEARGEIRGGRFVAGVTGEQFALPEAVGSLREVRRAEKTQTLVAVCGADPLNLVGILTSGARMPALPSNRLLFLDGVPLATLVGGTVQFLMEIEPELRERARTALVRRQALATALDFVG
jgi:ATP-dependent Lhr-like helicase